MRIRAQGEGGFTLIEIIVANVLLWGALLGLAAAGVLAATQVRQGKEYVKTSQVAQTAMEELYSIGYTGLSSGSDTISGTYTRWTVSGTDPKKVVLVVEHTLSSGAMRPDTFVTYMHRWQ